MTSPIVPPPADRTAVVSVYVRTKFAVTVLSAAIVSVVGFVSPDASPDQLANRYPAAAVAVTVAVEPLSYVPAPVTVPPPAGLANAVNVYVLRNPALTVLFAVIVTVVGFVSPDASPDQLANRLPAAAVAVTVAVEPLSYVPAPVTVPPLASPTNVVRVYV
jgi:hypothetical protein